jgi:hypothetical protein
VFPSANDDERVIEQAIKFYLLFDDRSCVAGYDQVETGVRSIRDVPPRLAPTSSRTSCGGSSATFARLPLQRRSRRAMD